MARKSVDPFFLPRSQLRRCKSSLKYIRLCVKTFVQCQKEFLPVRIWKDWHEMVWLWISLFCRYNSARCYNIAEYITCTPQKTNHTILIPNDAESSWSVMMAPWEKNIYTKWLFKTLPPNFLQIFLYRMSYWKSYGSFLCIFVSLFMIHYQNYVSTLYFG